MTKRILVLGGYGNFGKRIVEHLSQQIFDDEICILVTGRNVQKANALCQKLTHCQPLELDFQQPDFAEQLKQHKVELLIHTSGPFQDQDQTVPRACVQAGCHYLDLSDDRAFVCNIQSLDQQAKEKGILLVSGASSVPGISSTVISHYLARFSQLIEIDMAIAPGNKAERGHATIKGILSYIGRPFDVWEGGKWQSKYGWMDANKRFFSMHMSKRWMANVDVPDLQLFPEFFPKVRTVNFQAGLELPWLHLTMVFMAQLAKIGLVKNWAGISKLAFYLSNKLHIFGSDVGGMQVRMVGLDVNLQTLVLTWNLRANGGIGPYIPTFPTLILAKKLITGELTLTGAMPCLNLFELAEFEVLAKQYGITFELREEAGVVG